MHDLRLKSFYKMSMCCVDWSVFSCDICLKRGEQQQVGACPCLIGVLKYLYMKENIFIIVLHPAKHFWLLTDPGSVLCSAHCFPTKRQRILRYLNLYRWPGLGLAGFSWLLSVFGPLQRGRGCGTAFLVSCQSRSQFTFKASAQLSTPVVKPALSIHIVSVKMKIYISTVYPCKKKITAHTVAPAFLLMSLGGLGSDVTAVKQEVCVFSRLWTKRVKASCVLQSSGALCI